MAFTVSPWNVQAIATPHHLMHRFLWHRHVVGLAGGDLWPLASMMTKISYRGYRFPPVIIQTVRRWVNHFGSAIAADLRKRRPKPHCTWHLDEMYIKIDRRLVYLWRAVDAEGEVLDVLLQSKRDKRAALKLMRKLLNEFCARQAGDR
jgi:hypothetical protein